MSTAWWTVAPTGDARFPWRIRIERDGRVVLSVRAQDRWPGPGGRVFCLRERPAEAAEALEPAERVPVLALARRGRKLSVVLDRPRRRRCDFLVVEKRYRHREGTYEQIFFRTQSALGTHGARSRLQLRAGLPAGCELLVDTAERYPWRLAPPPRRTPLPAGDYALAEGGRLLAVVERKSFANLLHELERPQVLHQQLTDLGAFAHAALVVEARYADFLEPARVRPWSPARVARLLAELAALHPRVPLVYAGSRRLAAAWTSAFFAAVGSAAADASPDLVREAAGDWLPLHQGGTDWAVREAVLSELPDRFRIRELRARFPDVPDARLRRVLQALRAEGLLRTEGRGPGTFWVRAAAPPGPA